MHSLRELEREQVAERVKHRVGKLREKQGGWNQKTFNCFKTKNDLKEKEKLKVNDNLVEWKEVVYRKIGNPQQCRFTSQTSQRCS